MAKKITNTFAFAIIALISLSLVSCRAKTQEAATDSKDLPDIAAQIRPYVTVENTKVRTGPGPQFRAIGEIPSNAKVQVVGRDGEWVLIVSKKGNPPGYIEMASVKPGEAGEPESSAPPAEAKVEGRYESLVDTQVRSGPGLHYPVVAEIKKGTKLNVVDEDKGWLKVESKRGNKPGYVDASLAKLVASK